MAEALEYWAAERGLSGRLTVDRGLWEGVEKSDGLQSGNCEVWVVCCELCSAERELCSVLC